LADITIFQRSEPAGPTRFPKRCYVDPRESARCASLRDQVSAPFTFALEKARKGVPAPAFQALKVHITCRIETASRPISLCSYVAIQGWVCKINLVLHSEIRGSLAAFCLAGGVSLAGCNSSDASPAPMQFGNGTPTGGEGGSASFGNGGQSAASGGFTSRGGSGGGASESGGFANTGGAVGEGGTQNNASGGTTSSSGGVFGSGGVSNTSSGGASGAETGGTPASGGVSSASGGSSSSDDLETGRLVGITADHNAVRAAVQTTPAEPPLVWSSTLAQYAQDWADQLAQTSCANPHHRPYKDLESVGYGENLAAFSSTFGTPSSAADAVQGWAAESKCWTYGTIAGTEQCNVACYSALNSDGCGHYTQIVWRKSTQVGCGVASCQNGNFTTDIWICNYAPPGNYMGQAPY
jgi:pathogenesis-related protein 1